MTHPSAPRALTRLALATLLGLAAASCGSRTTAPPAPAHPMEVVIHNDRAATIYVSSQDSCGFEPIAMRDADGRGVRWGGQAHYCDDVREGNCPDFGGCAGAGVRPVPAGESFTYRWAGMMTVQGRVDSPGENCPSECLEVVGAPAGVYSLRATAFSTCEGECACEGETCPRMEGLGVAPDLEAEGAAAVGTDARVELHFTD